MAITATGRIVVAGQTDHVQPRTDGSYFVVPDFAVARYLG
jgi:hypothetical protein